MPGEWGISHGKVLEASADEGFLEGLAARAGGAWARCRREAGGDGTAGTRVGRGGPPQGGSPGERELGDGSRGVRGEWWGVRIVGRAGRLASARDANCGVDDLGSLPSRPHGC